MKNVALHSVSDTEAVQNVMERILKTMAEFREEEMRLKLKDCHKVRIRGSNKEGDKVWYQH